MNVLEITTKTPVDFLLAHLYLCIPNVENQPTFRPAMDVNGRMPEHRIDLSLPNLDEAKASEVQSILIDFVNKMKASIQDAIRQVPRPHWERPCSAASGEKAHTFTHADLAPLLAQGAFFLSLMPNATLRIEGDVASGYRSTLYVIDAAPKSLLARQFKRVFSNVSDLSTWINVVGRIRKDVQVVATDQVAAKQAQTLVKGE